MRKNFTRKQREKVKHKIRKVAKLHFYFAKFSGDVPLLYLKAYPNAKLGWTHQGISWVFFSARMF
jgi:hypothetical protein